MSDTEDKPKVGRPTTCTPDVIEQAYAYIENYETEHGDIIPSVVGLCEVINRTRSRVYEWAKKDDNPFRDILDRINQKQEKILIQKGLDGNFNSNIVKLVLGKHGYHEHKSVEHVTRELSDTERAARLHSILTSEQEKGAGPTTH